MTPEDLAAIRADWDTPRMRRDQYGAKTVLALCDALEAAWAVIERAEAEASEHAATAERLHTELLAARGVIDAARALVATQGCYCDECRPLADAVRNLDGA